MTTIEFNHIGNLNEFHSEKCSVAGVYLFVYKNERIIYVGQSLNIYKRLKTHRINMLRGGMTVWYPPKDTDIYDLMSVKDRENMNTAQLFGHYKELYKKNLCWLPGFKKDERMWLGYYDNKSFMGVEEEYLKNIELWVCEIADENESILVESKIQATLRKKFNIGYYHDHPQRSWLGKQEIIDQRQLDDYKMEISNQTDCKGIRELREILR